MTFTRESVYAVLATGAKSPLERKLESFTNLPQGWSNGEGQPVHADAARIAQEIVEIATQLQLNADVFPGLYGDCAVAFYDGDKCVEVILNPNSPSVFGLHVEQGHGHNFQTLKRNDEADYKEVVREIVKLVQPWKSHDYFHCDSLIRSADDFQMLSSSTHAEPLITHLMGV